MSAVHIIPKHILHSKKEEIKNSQLNIFAVVQTVIVCVITEPIAGITDPCQGSGVRNKGRDVQFYLFGVRG